MASGGKVINSEIQNGNSPHDDSKFLFFVGLIMCYYSLTLSA